MDADTLLGDPVCPIDADGRARCAALLVHSDDAPAADQAHVILIGEQGRTLARLSIRHAMASERGQGGQRMLER